jgi:hypothetical protein
MKNIALITALAILTLTACDKKPADKTPISATPTMTQTAPPIAPGTPMPAGHPDISGAMNSTATLSGMNTTASESSPASESVQTQSATVISAIDIPQFTYLEVKQGKETRWLAAATLAAKKGDIIDFDDGATMTNFNSKQLKRTFPSITFVNNASIATKK